MSTTTTHFSTGYHVYRNINGTIQFLMDNGSTWGRCEIARTFGNWLAAHWIALRTGGKVCRFKYENFEKFVDRKF